MIGFGRFRHGPWGKRGDESWKVASASLRLRSGQAPPAPSAMLLVSNQSRAVISMDAWQVNIVIIPAPAVCIIDLRNPLGANLPRPCARDLIFGEPNESSSCQARRLGSRLLCVTPLARSDRTGSSKVSSSRYSSHLIDRTVTEPYSVVKPFLSA